MKASPVTKRSTLGVSNRNSTALPSPRKKPTATPAFFQRSRTLPNTDSPSSELIKELSLRTARYVSSSSRKAINADDSTPVSSSTLPPLLRQRLKQLSFNQRLDGLIRDLINPRCSYEHLLTDHANEMARLQLHFESKGRRSDLLDCIRKHVLATIFEWDSAELRAFVEKISRRPFHTFENEYLANLAKELREPETSDKRVQQVKENLYRTTSRDFEDVLHSGDEEKLIRFLKFHYLPCLAVWGTLQTLLTYAIPYEEDLHRLTFNQLEKLQKVANDGIASHLETLESNPTSHNAGRALNHFYNNLQAALFYRKVEEYKDTFLALFESISSNSTDSEAIMGVIREKGSEIISILKEKGILPQTIDEKNSSLRFTPILFALNSAPEEDRQRFLSSITASDLFGLATAYSPFTPGFNDPSEIYLTDVRSDVKKAIQARRNALITQDSESSRLRISASIEEIRALSNAHSEAWESAIRTVSYEFGAITSHATTENVENAYASLSKRVVAIIAHLQSLETENRPSRSNSEEYERAFIKRSLSHLQPEELKAVLSVLPIKALEQLNSADFFDYESSIEPSLKAAGGIATNETNEEYQPWTRAHNAINNTLLHRTSGSITSPITHRKSSSSDSEEPKSRKSLFGNTPGRQGDW